MYSLIKKEISSFFSSITGYLIASVFLLANGLFLWILPTNFNLLENGYASLSSYFELAPWIFLFLIPALTMRLFAEEKSLGTFEILLTRPFSSLQLVVAKYLAGLFLVILCLLPTLVYFYSIYQLGNPVGNWDSGAAWGSFIGLFFLSALYVAIGIFCSSLTDNPVFSFVFALVISFIFYAGFDFILDLNINSAIKTIFLNLGINKHYSSLSRGVIDSRDVLYFLIALLIFIIATSISIKIKQQSIKYKLTTIMKFATFLGAIILISQTWFFRIDLTSEKRYSLSEVSKKVLSELEYPIYIDLYLSGDLPSGFRQLKQSIEEKIQDMNAISKVSIRLTENDIYEISDASERYKMIEQLTNVGLNPIDIRLKTDEGTSTKLIFPGAVIQYGDYFIAVNLLKNNQQLAAEINLNNSIETLEFEFINAIKNLLQDGNKPIISFLQGQNELSPEETYDIRNTLSANYKINDCTAEQLLNNDTLAKVLIIADPSTPFSEQDKFYIDQYLMNGGNIMYFIDPVNVSLDSLSNGEVTIGFPRDLKIMDQLFRYGIRINPNLIQDVECIYIPVNTSLVASQPKFKPSPWYYSPILTPSGNHVISRNINKVKSEFVSSIDILAENDAVRKSIILTSSPYARIVGTPAEISLQSINNPPSGEMFNTRNIPTGVLLEGNFTSIFKNRPSSQYNTFKTDVISESRDAKIIVISDGSIIANKASIREGKLQTQPLGYDQYSKQTFGNKEFIINAINYLSDDLGIMQLRSRVFKIRLLDKVKIREERTFWQILNIILPLIVILIFGLIYHLIRIRKYQK